MYVFFIQFTRVHVYHMLLSRSSSTMYVDRILQLGLSKLEFLGRLTLDR